MDGIRYTALVAIVSRASHSYTQVCIRIAAILVIGALDCSRMISAWNLQKSDTSLYSADYEVATKLVILPNGAKSEIQKDYGIVLVAFS